MDSDRNFFFKNITISCLQNIAFYKIVPLYLHVHCNTLNSHFSAAAGDTWLRVAILLQWKLFIPTALLVWRDQFYWSIRQIPATIGIIRKLWMTLLFLNIGNRADHNTCLYYCQMNVGKNVSCTLYIWIKLEGRENIVLPKRLLHI